mmetsp:Transcript_14367/g.22007  ORF Transcript_14367/g.22007 Transcript_14367/m.22007 type:complete len:219 (-) Transcript_14367:38-694(-)
MLRSGQRMDGKRFLHVIARRGIRKVRESAQAVWGKDLERSIYLFRQCVGLVVGNLLGVALGIVIGILLSVTLGISVGIALGKSFGAILGIALGANVGQVPHVLLHILLTSSISLIVSPNMVSLSHVSIPDNNAHVIPRLIFVRKLGSSAQSSTVVVGDCDGIVVFVDVGEKLGATVEELCGAAPSIHRSHVAGHRSINSATSFLESPTAVNPEHNIPS